MAQGKTDDGSIHSSNGRRSGKKDNCGGDAGSVSDDEKLSLGWIITIGERGTIVIPKEARPEKADLEKSKYYLATATRAGMPSMIILIPIGHAQARNKKQ